MSPRAATHRAPRVKMLAIDALALACADEDQRAAIVEAYLDLPIKRRGLDRRRGYAADAVDASQGKILTRAGVYARFGAGPRDRGVGVILTGPNDPGDELEMIQAIDWPLDRVVGVDFDLSTVRGLVIAAEAGVRAYSEDVVNVLQGLPEVAWFNGDFMGLSRQALHAVEIAAPRLVTGGSIALTFPRGREREHGNEAPGIAMRVGRGEDRRLDGIDRLVRAAARRGSATLHLEWSTSYKRARGIGMSMGVAVWRRA